MSRTFQDINPCVPGSDLAEILEWLGSVVQFFYGVPIKVFVESSALFVKRKAENLRQSWWRVWMVCLTNQKTVARQLTWLHSRFSFSCFCRSAQTLPMFDAPADKRISPAESLFEQYVVSGVLGAVLVGKFTVGANGAIHSWPSQCCATKPQGSFRC